ncbi:MAG: bifunctional diaminohydroxyphosphoribosylaminopyrimidine deaminase/5-amino-6-(5-phosphoribosylamino)uracil reductase RibD [Bacteroidia bacterium]
MNDFIPYMQRCLVLAAKGLGNVAPNPMVGCVIVHNDIIIGEGYHQKYGEAHAEVYAIASVADKSLLAESTVYVSLEPCSHQGKTPPCSNLLIKYKVKRVVVGCLDTNPLVAGKGIASLRNADIEVITGVLENEARELNKRFFTYHEKKRPYIILKWAQTKDNFISKMSPFTREENWITNKDSQQLVHIWRAEVQAILIGTNTAILDNPSLTVRLAEGENPIRILIDKDLKVPVTNLIFSDEAATVVFTDMDRSNRNNISYYKIDFTKNIIPQILETLFHLKITSVIIEGGTHTLQSFIDLNLWDEARVFTANKDFYVGIKAPVVIGKKTSDVMIGDDKLTILLNEFG